MFNRLRNLKPGAVVMTIGMGGLLFALVNPNMNILEKIVITIICIGLVILGVVIENPSITSITAEPVEHIDFTD